MVITEAAVIEVARRSMMKRWAAVMRKVDARELGAQGAGQAADCQGLVHQ